MTLAQIYTTLSAVNIPVYYDHTDNETAELPYIVYKEISTRTFASDNAVSGKISTVQVELYTTTRNIALEQQLEAALNGHIWSRQLDFGGDENYYSVFYTFEILGG